MFKTLIACAGILGATVAHADLVSGPYAGVGVGALDLEIDEDGIVFSGDDTAFKLFGGYRFNPYFILEATYLDGGAPSDTVLGQEIEIETSGLSVHAIGSIPLRRGWSLFGKLGLTKWEIEAKNVTFGAFAEDDGTDLSYGGGAMYDFSFPLRLRAELESINIEDVDVTLFTVSAAWRF